MEPEPLVAISEASQLLGVSEAALRQWTDEGRIKAFITPGGHRRYARADLKKFMASNHRMLGVKDLVVGLEDAAQSLRDVSRNSLNKTTWYGRLSQESQEHLAWVGRQLLSLIIRYVTEPSKREETIRLVRDVGSDLGQTLARPDVPLTDSVEAFILHRDPIMNAVTQLLRKKEAFNGRVVEAIPLITHVMDEALVSLVSAHQRYQSESRDEGLGGAIA
ncbi:MAG: helix-turn-helix domain-containing protein [Chloroflexota bacterium]